MSTDFLAASLTIATLEFTIYSLIQPLLSARIAEIEDEYRKYVVRRESVKIVRYLFYATIYFFSLSFFSAISSGVEVVRTSKISISFPLSVGIRSAVSMAVSWFDYVVPILFVLGVALEIYIVAWCGKRLSEALNIREGGFDGKRGRAGRKLQSFLNRAFRLIRSH